MDISPPKAQKQCYSVDEQWSFTRNTLDALVAGYQAKNEAEVDVCLWTKKYVEKNINKFKKVIEKQKKKSTSEQKGMFRCIIIYQLFVCDFTYICI